MHDFIDKLLSYKTIKSKFQSQYPLTYRHKKSLVIFITKLFLF